MSLSHQYDPTRACPIVMSDGHPCGRPIYKDTVNVDREPVCLMHSADPNKDLDRFHEEIYAIVKHNAAYARGNLDFSRFVFFEYVFNTTVFDERAIFVGV